MGKGEGGGWGREEGGITVMLHSNLKIVCRHRLSWDLPKLQALVYDTLPPTAATAGASRKTVS